jgi:hypothetical protein
MAKESKPQKATIERVMHEKKTGTLKTPAGKRVTSRKQAVAIALHEAGVAKPQAPKSDR